MMEYHPVECRCGFKMSVPRNHEGQIVFCRECGKEMFIPKSISRKRGSTRILLRCSQCRRIWYGASGMGGSSVPCPPCEKQAGSPRRKKSGRPGGTTVLATREFLQA